MNKAKLFFATNRNHEGKDRWNPTGYGEKFSSDGHQNLRFGELSVEAATTTVEKCLAKRFDEDRIGDGEGLSNYLSKQAKRAQITAYKDSTAQAKKAIETTKNSSYRFFQNIKKAMMKASDVVIYVHGYNVSWNEAVGGALALQYMLNAGRTKEEKEVMVVLFSWPSNGSMMPFAAYKSDRTDARDSGRSFGRGMLKLRDFLVTLRRDAKEERDKLCDQEIHLLCHSMGNYLLQKGLENKFIGYAGGSIMPRMFKHVFLCAADVNDDVLEKNEGMERLHELAGHVTVYFNKGDVAMNISQYTKNMAERLGHTGSAHPALVHNKVHQVDCSPIVKGLVEHSYYLWATVNKDIRQSIMGMSHEDSERNRRRTGQNREWVIT